MNQPITCLDPLLGSLSGLRVKEMCLLPWTGKSQFVRVGRRLSFLSLLMHDLVLSDIDL